MTCRERLKIEHPEHVGDVFRGGCRGCPASYRYLDMPTYCKEDVEDKCSKCWDREIPEDKEPKSLSQFAGEASEATFEKRGIISQPIKDAMTKFGEECVDHAKAMERALEPIKNSKMERDDGFIGNKIEIVGESTVNIGHIIKDSGNRTEFASGAVRDMREGKGRCDLMPLDVVADILRDPIIDEIAKFQEDGKDVTHLYKALLNVPQSEVFPDVHTMFLEVAKHFEAGCKKYGEDNWRKGIPAKCYIDSAVRHYLKFLRGDKDEPHDRAFVWNILCCVWTVKHLGVNADGGSENK